MTPAERLLAAADLLDKRAGEATAGPWVEAGIGEYGWSVISQADPRSNFGVETEDSEQGKADAAYIATVHPEVGKQQAAMLRSFAYAVDREWRTFHEMWNTEARVRMLNDRMPGLNAALAIADLMLEAAA